MKTLCRSVFVLTVLALAAWCTEMPRIGPVGSEGHCIGFDVSIGDGLRIPVRFASNGVFFADTVGPAENDGGIVFSGFHVAEGTGVTLGPGTRITVCPGPPDDPFPQITFVVELMAFDVAVWQSRMGGPCPFHFLILSLNGAEAIHHRGFLVATPSLDPYTLKVGRQGSVASRWSRDWTWAPPFGACPIPLAGLWAPAKRTYAAFDFMEARLRDHSEKFLASAYCSRLGDTEDFIALVYPYAEQYVSLSFPRAPVTLSSHCRLLYHVDLPYWDDPNRWYHARLWRQYSAELPGVPEVNDMDWLPGYARAYTWPGVGPCRMTYTVPEKDEWESKFFEPGTVIPRGPDGHSVDVFVALDMTRRLKEVRDQFPYLLGKLKWFTVNGERCCYWEKPLEGQGRPRFAGDVTTMRNIHGWGIADVMLALYEAEGDPKLLEVVEGVLNWTRYNICTRNDISDVPEAMFTIGWCGTRLCLRYNRLFRDDPVRAERAGQALDLAHALAYRYTTVFMPDTAEDDAIDGTFLIEPNSARPWTGMPCANECNQIPDELLRVYVATGDPILLAYVRGMVERWHLLYQDEMCLNTAASDTPFTECWGLFDGCAKGGRDIRASYGGLGNFDLMKPVGEALVRVVCGEKGAAAFNRCGVHTDIADYRAGRGLEPGLSFRVVSSLRHSFELDLTTPNRVLRGRPVSRMRQGTTVVLRPGTDYTEPPQSLWDIAIADVCDGDVIILGRFDESEPLLPIAPVKKREPGPGLGRTGDDFVRLDLRGQCNWSPDRNWDDSSSWAPLTPGPRLAWGVPFFVLPPEGNPSGTAIRDGDLKLTVPLDARAFALFVSGTGTLQVRVRMADGRVLPVSMENTITAWQAWPRWFPARITLVPFLPDAGQVAAVEVRNGILWAVTAATDERGRETVAAVIDRVRSHRAVEEADKALAERRVRELRTGCAIELTAEVPQGESHCYVYMYIAKAGDGLPEEGMTIPADAFLEYDVMIPFSSIRDTAGVDLTGGTLGNLRDRVSGTHPAGRQRVRGEWIHVRRAIGGVAGERFEYVVVATDGGAPQGLYKAYFRDIVLTDGAGTVLHRLYDNGPVLPARGPGISPNGGKKNMTGEALRVIPAVDVDAGMAKEAMIAIDGIARDDFSGYGNGVNGAPAWAPLDGQWSIVDGVFVGRNCTPKGWNATGAGGGDVTWRDYDLDLRFQIRERGSDWRDGAWIGFRCNARQRSGYSLNCHARQIALHKTWMGRSSGDSTALAAAPWTPDNAWHRVQIKLQGARITVSMDGTLLFAVVDENLLGVPPIPGGNVVLCARRWSGSEGNTEVAFDDVEVHLQGGPGSPRE